jgi:hypothetical protein
MLGQRIGYIGVSTIEQNTERQLEGIEVAKTFTDKASGKDTQRPQLEALIDLPPGFGAGATWRRTPDTWVWAPSLQRQRATAVGH